MLDWFHHRHKWSGGGLPWPQEIVDPSRRILVTHNRSRLGWVRVLVERVRTRARVALFQS